MIIVKKKMIKDFFFVDRQNDKSLEIHTYKVEKLRFEPRS
jgi:hypothetical protein